MEQYLKNKYYQITNGKQLNINIKSDPIKQLKQEINYFKSFVSIVKEYCENVGLQLFINTEKNQSDKGYISQVIINEKTFCQGSDLIKKISREIACEKFIQKCLNQDFEVNEEDYYDQGEEVSNSLDFSKLDYYDPLVNYLYFLQVFQKFKDKQGQNEVVDFTYKDLQEEGVGITKFQAKNQAIFKMLQTLKKTNEFQNFMKKLPENQNQESLKQPNIRKRQRKQRKQKQTFQNSKLIKKQKSNDIQQLILIDLDSQANKIKYNQTQQDISKETQSEKQSQIKEEMLFKKRETNQLGNQTDQNKDQHSQFIQIIQELKQKEQNQNQSNQTLDSLSLNEIIPVQNNESQIKQVNKIQPTQESQNSQDKQLKSKSQSQNKQAKGDEIILDDQNSKQPIVITDYDKTPKNTSFIQDRSVILINIDQEVSQQENLKILSNINSNQSNQLFKSQQNEPEESKSNEVNSQNTEQINSKCQNNNQINLEVSKYLDQKLFRVANSALYNSLTQKVFEYLSYNSISQETYIQIANMIDNIDVFSQECQLGVVFFQIVGSLFYKIVCKDQVIGDIVIVCDSSISNQSEENTKLEIFKKIKQLSVGSKVQQYFNCMSLKQISEFRASSLELYEMLSLIYLTKLVYSINFYSSQKAEEFLFEQNQCLYLRCIHNICYQIALIY